MKKGLILAGLVTVLCLSPAYAKAEQLGVYVTPKFVYGATVMDNTKIYDNYRRGGGGNAGQTYDISNGSDSAFGGSLAVGYNFNKRFNLPIRAELEYAIFSEVETDGSYTQSIYEPGDGAYRAKESYEQKFHIQTLFVNAYYDFHTGTAFTPYLGGGLGVAFINTKAKDKLEISNSFASSSSSESISSGSKTRSNFAWNIGAGLAYDFTENLALDLGYRFVGLGSAKTKTNSSVDESGDTRIFHGKTQDLYMHQVSLGLRFSF